MKNLISAALSAMLVLCVSANVLASDETKSEKKKSSPTSCRPACSSACGSAGSQASAAPKTALVGTVAKVTGEPTAAECGERSSGQCRPGQCLAGAALRPRVAAVSNHRKATAGKASAQSEE